MKVLHLFSNSKWTGPAEPALNLCLALRELGVDVDFACAPGRPDVPNKIVETARDRGLEPVLRFRLDKHYNPFFNVLDARALARFLRGRPYDVIHCHLDNDHRIAAALPAAKRPPIVRSSYTGTGFSTRREGRLLHSASLVLQPSSMALEHDARTHGYPRERMHLVAGAVDTVRFDPARETPDGRRRLNLPPEAVLIGIVARMQTHRHYEDLLEAFRRLRQDSTSAHLVIIGRGTRQEEVARRPVRELGLEPCVHFTGYLAGEDYVGMLRALDFAVFLVPGSDGTCRAVRELLAMGKPVIAAARGMLPEIVTHESDGLVFDGSVPALHTALLRLTQAPQERRHFGKAAREKALRDYALPVQAERVKRLYACLG
ncbi:MAG: glycosyltransferase family 4 protein [Candidatus Hydrogenedentes bacterium]|nr:glycosyltransferase family 4 protein [Candidatus Hydrogenedentota bacterium]